jgi:hypothetical protein
VTAVLRRLIGAFDASGKPRAPFVQGAILPASNHGKRQALGFQAGRRAPCGASQDQVTEFGVGYEDIAGYFDPSGEFVETFEGHALLLLGKGQPLLYV